MSPRLVYRFEHPEDGKGPFTSGTQVYKYDLHAWNMPTPYAEKIDFTCDFYCAMANLEKLYFWFTASDREVLYESGFELVAYMVPAIHVKDGEQQCMFNKGEAIKAGDVE